MASSKGHIAKTRGPGYFAQCGLFRYKVLRVARFIHLMRQ